MREKVIFQRNVLTYSDGGDVTAVWSDYYKPLAVSVKEVRPSLDIVAQQQGGSMYIEVIMRYNPEMTLIIGDRIIWRGINFNSIQPPIVDRVKRMVKILCIADIESSGR